jgi:hypothetical protein
MPFGSEAIIGMDSALPIQHRCFLVAGTELSQMATSNLRFPLCFSIQTAAFAVSDTGSKERRYRYVPNRTFWR